ncbi:DUF2000 family protein [Chromobacterium vaccinii]|nr:DUF2000 family protein [Chromobacterium vaccinii]
MAAHSEAVSHHWKESLMDDIRCAIIIDPDLPPGIIANTAAVLAM